MSDLADISKLVLKDSGWSPERKVDPTPWIKLLENTGYPAFDALVNILECYGGLKITTSQFQKKPFILDQQKVILVQRSDPLFEFTPDKSEAIELSQVSSWKSLNYVQNRHLQIAPLGIRSFSYPRLHDFFVLSDSRIFGGGEYWEGDNRDERVPGLFYLGNDIEDAINNALEEILAYW